MTLSNDITDLLYNFNAFDYFNLKETVSPDIKITLEHELFSYVNTQPTNVSNDCITCLNNLDMDNWSFLLMLYQAIEVSNLQSNLYDFFSHMFIMISSKKGLSYGLLKTMLDKEHLKECPNLLMYTTDCPEESVNEYRNYLQKIDKKVNPQLRLHLNNNTFERLVLLSKIQDNKRDNITLYLEKKEDIRTYREQLVVLANLKHCLILIKSNDFTFSIKRMLPNTDFKPSVSVNFDVYCYSLGLDD